MNDWVANAVDRHVEALSEERLPDGKWHPSSIAGPCIRKAVLEKNGVPFTTLPDEQTKRVFRIGHIFHKFVQDAMAGDPEVKLVIPEIEVEIPRLNISGTADALVLKRNGDYELEEIKSIKEAGLSYTLPKEEHTLQAAVYAYGLREEGGIVEGMKLLPLGERLTSIRVIYVSKENMRIVEKVVPYTSALESKMMMRLHELSAADRRYEAFGELPLRLNAFDRSKTWYMNYCPYRSSGKCCGD